MKRSNVQLVLSMLSLTAMLASLPVHASPKDDRVVEPDLKIKGGGRKADPQGNKPSNNGGSSGSSSTTTTLVSSPTPVGYTPAQIKRAYGIDSISGDGFGQTIAIVVAFGSPSVQRDLDIFSDTFGLPRTTVEIIYATKAPRSGNQAWANETTMDVQWAHAIAPRAKIKLVVAEAATMSSLLGAVNKAKTLGAAQIAMSWGGPESTNDVGTYESVFSNAPGITFIASAGEKGYPIYPGTSPKVVSVGGTSLSLDDAGNRIDEVHYPSAFGGFSAYQARPAYQANLPLVSAKRAVPDVTLSADNTGVKGAASYYGTSYPNQPAGWYRSGGTSFGPPVVAGVMALVNSSRSSPIGNKIHNLLYSQRDSISFTDIVSGCRNIASPSAPLSCATSGFDFVSGLGAPNAANLVPALIVAP